MSEKWGTKLHLKENLLMFKEATVRLKENCDLSRLNIAFDDIIYEQCLNKKRKVQVSLSVGALYYHFVYVSIKILK